MAPESSGSSFCHVHSCSLWFLIEHKKIPPESSRLPSCHFYYDCWLKTIRKLPPKAPDRPPAILLWLLIKNTKKIPPESSGSSSCNFLLCFLIKNNKLSLPRAPDRPPAVLIKKTIRKSPRELQIVRLPFLLVMFSIFSPGEVPSLQFT